MTDQLLGVLKIVLLLALYLFFARVLWAVWNEVRIPAVNKSAQGSGAPKTVTPDSPVGAVKVPRPYRVARMKVISPAPLRGFTFTPEQPFTVGRSTDNDMCLDDDEFASTHHARFVTNDGRTYVEDLASTNGTFVNNNRIDQIVNLKIGDRVQIGSAIVEAIK
ncbi:MAG: FHA domain-containing protein [Actinomycetes bacterium]